MNLNIHKCCSCVLDGHLTPHSFSPEQRQKMQKYVSQLSVLWYQTLRGDYPCITASCDEYLWDALLFLLGYFHILNSVDAYPFLFLYYQF